MLRMPCMPRPAGHAVARALVPTLALLGGPAGLLAQSRPASAPLASDSAAAALVRPDTAGRDPASAPAAPAVTATGPYATPALRALVALAARGNRLPPDLTAYRADVETEIAVALRREDGIEGVAALEQVATTLRWTRAGYYDQHVVGYRAQQTGLGVSMLSIFRTGWASPVLYGNRLSLRRDTPGDSARARRDSIAGPGPTTTGVGPTTTGAGQPAGRLAALRRARAGRRPATDTLPVVHPLAADRDLYYRFTGGDTVVTLRAGGAAGAREIPIVRVHVAPRPDLTRRAGLFEGELELDATRHALVRLRGHFLVAPPDRSVRARLGRSLVQGFAYVEYVNAERQGRWWLPAWQRLELQAGSGTFGDQRAIIRIVSRFRDLAVNDTVLPPADLVAGADSLLPRPRRRLTWAPTDSVRRYDAWRTPLGGETGALHADDFLDVAPDPWRPTGPPRANFHVQRLGDVARFNRVEGAFTGGGVRVRFRDRAPGLVLRATGGWAWAEGTARGRVEVERRLGLVAGPDAEPGDDGEGRARPAPLTRERLAGARWTVGARIGRTLDVTNDFRFPLDSAAALVALSGTDPYDWVDRRLATLSLVRTGGAGPAALLAGEGGAVRGSVARLELGVADDRSARAHVRQGLFGAGPGFRANRGVDEGRWLRTALTLELRPDVAAEFVRPGVGVRLAYERGDGGLFDGGTVGGLGGGRGLSFQRADVRLMVRRPIALPWPGRLAGSTLALVARGDAGAVWSASPGGPPPQQLFELGVENGLPGYRYKEFAGDRAGLVRGFLLYTGPWYRDPLRVRLLGRPFILPGLAPGLSVGVQGGRAEASGEAARLAVLRLGGRVLASGVPVGPVGPGGLPAPASRPTDGLRASFNAGLRLFNGAVFVGAARPVDGQTDRRGGWRGVVLLNQGI